MLKEFMDQIEAELDLTEPALLEDGTAVVAMAPSQGGLVGLDVDTGKPVAVPWKYKAIHEKPVIINAGGKQTVIPPKPLPPLPPPAPIVTTAEAGALYEAMRARYQPSDYMTEAEVTAKNVFVKGCLADADFYIKWRSRLGMLERAVAPKAEPPTAPGDWPAKPKKRQRIVDI